MDPESKPVHPLKLVESTRGAPYQTVGCPLCGDEYQHSQQPVRTFNASDAYRAGWDGRGDLLTIPFNGECGSKWELCVGFHKGNSDVFVRIIESCLEPPLPEDQ